MEEKRRNQTWWRAFWSRGQQQFCQSDGHFGYDSHRRKCHPATHFPGWWWKLPVCRFINAVAVALPASVHQELAAVQCANTTPNRIEGGRAEDRGDESPAVLERPAMKTNCSSGRALRGKAFYRTVLYSRF
ncbi:hypothetical protein quinque_002386 [Culex quinquefasciatus]